MQERYSVDLFDKDDNITIECSDFERFQLLTRAIKSVLTNSRNTIAPEDNPEAGVDTQIPIDFEQSVAAAAFGGTRATMSPEQQIAAHAAGALPAPVINPVAAIPGGAAAAQAPQIAPPAPETDKRGVRWDHRIHASTKTLNADGTWRQRRGVDEALVAQVEAEQRTVDGLPPPPVVAAVPVAQPVAIPPVPVAVTVVPPPPPVVAAAPVVPPAPVVPVVPAPAMDFPGLCEWMNGPMLAVPPKLTLDEVNGVLKNHGFGNLPMLIGRPDYVPTIHAELQALVASKG